MKIVFATNNQHKLSEIRSILGEQIEVLSLKDIGCDVDIPETGTTLEANALQKAQYVYDHYHLDCFADDTGLEVEALDGAPGVYSARYASMAPDADPAISHDSEANMARLLRELGDNDNRKARFRTVIALIQKKNVCPCGCTAIKEVHRFEGIVEGQIIRERRGGEGFGYDPIFQPEGYDQTFAELGMEVKNHISHRARATQKLANYLLRIMLMLLFVFHVSVFTSSAQVGTWHNYLAYHEVQDIQKAGDDLFVLASNALYQYNLNDQSITTYDKTNGLSDTYITHIGWSSQARRLIAVYANSNIDLVETNGNVTNISSLYSYSTTEDKTVTDVRIDGIYAWLVTGFAIIKVNLQRAEITETYTPNHPDYPTSLPEKDQSAYDKYLSTVSTLSPGGPHYNHFFESKFVDGKLYTTGGYFLSGIPDPLHPGIVQIYDGNDWLVCQENVSETTGYQYIDDNCIDVMPLSGDNRVMVGGKCGLYEFTDGKLTNYYNKDNSPLKGAYDRGKTLGNNYVLISAIKYDDSGQLWVLNNQAEGTSLLELSPDGQWTDHHHSELVNDNGITLKAFRSMFFDSRGLLWFVNNNWEAPALFCYDKQSDTMLRYDRFVNQDNTRYTVNYVYAACEDRDGNIWVGTDIGPFMIRSGEVGQSEVTFYQVKIPRNDGTNYADYLLSGVSINSIAIDGGNRKWFGTVGAGVFLISADNMEQIHHFTIDNSKLITNQVSSININQQTGEVFFLSDAGLCSYMSDATESYETMDDDHVYAYPNPVTPDYTGLITVTGLSYDADVKITSTSGALIAEGRSNGGMFTWDGRDRNGHRVASGVYFVVTATSGGKKGTVCKIAIIN